MVVTLGLNSISVLAHDDIFLNVNVIVSSEVLVIVLLPSLVLLFALHSWRHNISPRIRELWP